MKKKTIKLFVLLSFLFPIAINSTNVVSTYAASNVNNITPRKPIIEYRYKVSHGKLYKRLYDATNDRWLGPWKEVV